jgi:hypothetical protein
MTRAPGALAAAAIAEAKALLSSGDTAGAVARYRESFDRLVELGEHSDASTLAHMAGVAEPDPGSKNVWNTLALREAEAEPDRASIAWFYPSLYNNLAVSHAQRGEPAEALRCLRLAWANVAALEPGAYAERVTATIRKRLDELESAAAPRD